jgi:hypothetical protein
MRSVLTALALNAAAFLPAAANDFSPIRDQKAFLSLVEGRELRLNMFRVSIEVLPDGRIEGSALGWDLSGTWDWQDGYFCRELDWSGSPIPFNCQLVEVSGEDRIRFTVDKGEGDSASFTLR